MNKLTKINGAFAILGTLLAKILGGWDMALKALVAMMVADYVTGVLVAIFDKKLNSEIGYKGIVKKLAIFIIVYMATMIDKTIGGETVRLLAIMFYIANEGLSVLENIGKMGVSYPPKLKAVLAQLRDKDVE